MREISREENKEVIEERKWGTYQGKEIRKISRQEN